MEGEKKTKNKLKRPNCKGTISIQNGANVSFHPPLFVIPGSFQTTAALLLSHLASFRTNLRPHVEQVPHCHVGVALAVAVALSQEFVLGPGHVDPLWTRFRLVIYGGVGRCVAVMDELRLEGRWRKKEVRKQSL